ncbi:toxin-activating lysine-acyltransferase [Vibrio metschnikovii]|uniref:toxin-activating lysine-acyltransferase n=1 Tax=Vibrio metschnikovii TaxID=28172 RepID=UPI0016452C78|nr:toxin-activating lysine-acyltransferase [Vibrio metschnikovii]MBC3620319.1 toxin-activating lysine-acyltransferase [Vibrio metschnikovii]
MQIKLKTAANESSRNYEKLGVVLSLLARIYPDQQVNMAYINQVVFPAIEHNQLAIFCNYDEMPIAFVIWYRLTPETLARVAKYPYHPLHISEWNEGDQLWLHNLYACSGALAATVKYIKYQLFIGEPHIYFMHKNQKRCITLYDKENQL